MLVLGIETSCDETSAALVRNGVEVLSNVVASQVEAHREYGGIVPEVAARAHVEAMVPVVGEALAPAGGRPDLVAVTLGPGLVGSLIVGLSAAKGLAWSWGVPLIGVNHLEAHAYSVVVEGMLPETPFLALVVSGGHTMLLEVRGPLDMEVVGETLDDAIGEAFDKVARLLGLGYPGGPVIDRISAGADARAVTFPRAMASSGDYNFSLSGLKTAVVRYMEKAAPRVGAPTVADVAASFQEAALEVIARKTVDCALELGASSVVLGGGVACNTRLRTMLEESSRENAIALVYPSGSLCTDNAAMVAALGYFQHELGGRMLQLDADVYPNLRPGTVVPGSRYQIDA